MAVYKMASGGWFNTKMPPYSYRKSDCRDKTILLPSYLHIGISYTGKMASLYRIMTLFSVGMYFPWSPAGISVFVYLGLFTGPVFSMLADVSSSRAGNKQNDPL